MSDAPSGAGRARSVLGDPYMMPEPPVELMAFARRAYVLTCLSEPALAVESAAIAGHDPVAFKDQARVAGLALSDSNAFYAWVRSSRLNAAAYDYLCAQEGSGTPTHVNRYDA